MEPQQEASGIRMWVEPRSRNRVATIIEHFPADWNLDALVREFRHAFRCGGIIDFKRGLTIIRLQGDQRQNVLDFCAERGVGEDAFMQM